MVTSGIRSPACLITHMSAFTRGSVVAARTFFISSSQKGSVRFERTFGPFRCTAGFSVIHSRGVRELKHRA